MKDLVKYLGFFSLGCLALGLSACATTTRAPVIGLLFNGSRAGELVTSAPAATKRGESCAHSVLGLVAFGDASIAAAKRNSGIRVVSSVDGDNLSILGVYAKYCTIVTGE
jgi:hypothetical protein